MIRWKFFEFKRNLWIKLYKIARKKAYPWWDYSNFYSVMGEWLEDASKNFLEEGNHVGAEKSAKQMLIASELCKRISNGYADENSYETAFKVKLEDVEFDISNRNFVSHSEEKSRKYKKWKEYQKRDNDLYFNLLFQILKKHSLNWWD